MDDPSLLSDVNRWVGVSIALVGSVIVAPTGTGLLWHSGTDWLRQRGHQALGQLSRLLPFLHRPVTVQPHDSHHGHFTSSLGFRAFGSGRAWPSVAPIEERIEALRRHIANVERQVNELIHTVSEETPSSPDTRGPGRPRTGHPHHGQPRRHSIGAQVGSVHRNA